MEIVCTKRKTITFFQLNTIAAVTVTVLLWRYVHLSIYPGVEKVLSLVLTTISQDVIN